MSAGLRSLCALRYWREFVYVTTGHSFTAGTTDPREVLRVRSWRPFEGNGLAAWLAFESELAGERDRAVCWQRYEFTAHSFDGRLSRV